ncbi:MAG: hypothetical protein HZA13_06745 [Nitrospirae bacterium]|nr:hypothetical protein [Nitrospirota bacterium]
MPTVGQHHETPTEKREIPISGKAEKLSPAFAEFILRKNLKMMLLLLEKLKDNLGKLEGAAFMTGFREQITKAWEIKDALPKERVLLVSTLEEAIRGKKWRDLTIEQIEQLKNIIEQTGDLSLNQKKMAELFRALHKSGIDIYPAATVDEDDD